MKWQMDALEDLANNVFNVLPIVTGSILRYFICVISFNNSME